MAVLPNVCSAILAFAKLQLIDARYKKNVSAHGRSAQRNYFCPKLKSLKKYLLLFFCITALNTGQAQSPNDSTKYLLLDMALQLQITDAIDDMYNFDFRKAEVEFNWMRYNYPEHPLPYFLFGISTWWQMMPNLDKETPLGDEFLAYMDQAIEKAENMLDVNEDNMEAEFFLAEVNLAFDDFAELLEGDLACCFVLPLLGVLINFSSSSSSSFSSSFSILSELSSISSSSSLIAFKIVDSRFARN